MAVQTFRERWTLFAGTLLSVALGAGLVESSALVLQASSRSARSGAVSRLEAGNVQSFIGITLMLALFLSVFIISSTFSFTVTERRRDLALLRLGGASRAQLRRLLMAEAGLVGLVGSLVGLGAGLLLARVQLALLDTLGMPAALLRPRPSIGVALTGVGTGLGISLVGAWVAARRAARVRPLEALRDVGAAARVMTPARWCWGLGFALVTAAGVVTTQASTDVLVAITVGLGIVFSGSIAFQQLSPLVVPLAGRLVAVLVRRWTEGEIAAANLVDARRRAATTAGPLIVLVGLVVGLFGILQSQTAAAVLENEHGTRAQLVVETTGVDPQRIADVAGVAAAAPLTELPGQVGGAAPGDDALDAPTVLATDPADYRAVMRPRLVSGHLADFGDDSLLVGDDADGVVGDRQPVVQVTTGGTTSTLRVAGRTGMSLAQPFTVLVPRSAVSPELLQRLPTRTMVAVEPGSTVPEVQRRLLEAGFRASTVTAWATRDTAAVDRTNRSVMTGLAGLGGLYALLSVVNAVALGAAARKREFAVDRVTGMTRAQVVRTSVLESLATGLIGVLLGAAVAALCLLGVARGLSAWLGQPVRAVPWEAFALLSAGSLGAVAATAAAATWSATRQRPVALAAARE